MITLDGLYSLWCTLIQAISELENVKNSLRQPFLAKQMVAASLQRLEDGLRKQTQVRALDVDCDWESTAV